MLVQGSPTRNVKMKNPSSDEALKMPRIELKDSAPSERLVESKTTTAKRSKKTRWNLSCLLVAQCPEFLVSLSQNY
jgi:hypothetical protein